MRRIIIFSLLFTGTILKVFSQNISGTIIDAKTGEAIVGANMVIKGTQRGASSDINGNYLIPAIEPGEYTLEASFISFKSKTIPAIVLSGQNLTINIALEEDVTELSDIVVLAMRQTDTDLDLLKYMKITDLVVSGVSSEQISKSQDRDAAQVVRRVPGVTLIDDRFIVVRGLSSRYNTVMLNGVLAPSTETESRAFSFDIIPSSLLDRIMVYKSGAAELPGEFGGSVVNIQTKNVVEENFTSFNFSVGHRQKTTSKNFNAQRSENLDWLTLGDKSRALPSGAPSDYRNMGFDYDRIVAESRKFENNWGLRSISAMPDLRGRLDIGKVFSLGNLKINSINSISYSNTNKGEVQKRNRYINYNSEGVGTVEFNYDDEQFSNSVRIGALSNWLIHLNNRNRLEFRNLYTRMGKSETTFRTGTDEDKGQEIKNYSLRYNTRTIYLGQMQGTHDFLREDSKLTWLFGVSTSGREEPDWRRISTRRNIGTERPYQVNIPSNANASDASKFYQSVDEINLTHRLDLEYSFDTPSDRSVKLKTGYFGEYKNRNVSARTIGFIKAGNNFDPQIGALPYDQIFNIENLKAPDGIIIAENTKYTDEYDASNLLVAGYVGSTLPMGSRFSLIPGLRIEYDQLNLETGVGPGGSPDKIENLEVSLLPSFTLNYDITLKSKLRMAYSKSINRPEFRELAPFSFYDFGFEVDIMGNPNLEIADISNFDLRWEFYPSPVELISMGMFYKNFNNPIEAKIIEGTSKPVFVFDNAHRANAYGMEVEIRKELENLIDNGILKKFSVLFNGSYIISEIDLGSTSSYEDKVRPLQGQSPYVINAGIFYQDYSSGTQISMLYNVAGKRIFSVGSTQYPTIYEMPRNLVDLTVSQKLGQVLDLRLGVSNILSSKLIYREDGNRDGEIDDLSADKEIFNSYSGRVVNLGLSLKF